MAISSKHYHYHAEAFAVPGFFSDPVLVFGFQDFVIPKKKLVNKFSTFLRSRDKIGLIREKVAGILAERRGKGLDAFRRAHTFREILETYGVRDLHVLDFFDDRADLRFDMNYPIPEDQRERYGTVIDIGCLEHLFNSAQCLENCLRMVRPGGHYFLHTPVNGYFGHGLHVFNPVGLIDVCKLNGFEVKHVRYSTEAGAPVTDPSVNNNVIIWLVAQKTQKLEQFVCPQQREWVGAYPVAPGFYYSDS
jgi:SAM-dependent methyltransferase